MIVAFGTINVDMVTVVARFPVPGETVKGLDYQLFPGGKGANQALAAARAGASVMLCGAVGSDGFADVALSNLADAGIDLSMVRRSESPTGIYMIAIDPSGENLMIGANAANESARAAWMATALRDCDTFVTQNSLGTREVEAAIARAHRSGCRVVYNAAPAEPVSEETFRAADVVIVNEHEALRYAAMLGIDADPVAFVRGFCARFGGRTVVTRGAEGLVAAFDGRVVAAAPPSVTAVDATGAGDAFCGALAASLDRGDPFERALKEGLAAGSLACVVTGAQTSFQTHAEIARLAADIHLRDIDATDV